MPSLDDAGFVTSLDLTSEAWGPVWIYDPTTSADSFEGVAVDATGSTLYASGAMNAPNADPSLATGVVVELALPLAAGAAPLLTLTPAGFPTVSTVSVDEGDVYISGGDTAMGRAAKCSGGTCPP